MKTVVFIHGAWVTPACWDQFSAFYTKRGYRCLAPPWPRKDRSIEQLRNDSSGLAGLGVQEIIDHYDRIIRDQPEPPILIGHSFGGLFVQMLLDRGLGAAGVAIDSAPPRGVFATELSVFRANLPVLMQPGARKGVVRMSYPQFRYAFVNVLSDARPRRGRRDEPLQFQKVRAVQGTDRFQSVPWPLPRDHRAGRLARGRQRHGPL